jgi:membrane protein YdbS with pleckstrin-like domain
MDENPYEAPQTGEVGQSSGWRLQAWRVFVVVWLGTWAAVILGYAYLATLTPNKVIVGLVACQLAGAFAGLVAFVRQEFDGREPV